MNFDSKADILASQVQARIDETGLEPGTALGTKAELVERYKVARGTLNEALRLLQSRGYIDVRPGPNGGAFVAGSVGRMQVSRRLAALQDDPQQLEDCFQVQDALEERITMSAAATCTPSDAVRIRGALVQLNAAVGAEQMIRSLWEVDRQIALTSANLFLAETYCTVLDRIAGLVMRWPSDIAGEDSSAHVHEDLALAVIRNDIIGAQSASREHSPVDPVQLARETLAKRSARVGAERQH